MTAAAPRRSKPMCSCAGIASSAWAAKTKEEWENAVVDDRPRLETYLRERIALRGGPQAILLTEAPYTNQTLAQVAERLRQPAEQVVIDVMGYGAPGAAR